MKIRNSVLPRCGAGAMILFLLLAAQCTLLGQQEEPPKPDVPRTVSIPVPVERTLANGLRVIVVERRNVPLVTAKLFIRNGSEVDPNNLSGLANMTADLLTKGTKTRSAPEIAAGIEALGGSINAGAGWDSSFVSVGVMSDKLADALTIMADVARNPAFADEEIERVRAQDIDGLSVSLHQPGTLAGIVAARVIFGDSPYGHPLSGTPESIGAIKRDDIVKLHSTYFRPDNAVLVIGGDIAAATGFKLAQTYFGDWAKPAAPVPAPAVPDAMATQGNGRVIVVDLPSAGQAAVVTTSLGIRRSDIGFFKGIVANTVLGGGYSARLNQEIRIKRGLSYGAGSRLSARRETGSFAAQCQTKNESAAEVAQLMLVELERMSSELVPDVELVPRKATLIGDFSRSLETVGGLVDQIGTRAIYGLKLTDINAYTTFIQAVAPADIQQFAAARFKRTGMNVVIVGNAAQFLDALKQKFQNVEVIPYDKLNLNSANLRKS